MKTYKILFSNLGYLRGINGSLSDHVRYAYRHIYCSPEVQKHSILQLKNLLTEEDPDLCCFVEIDRGSFTSAGFNQVQELSDKKYRFFDIENKYRLGSRLRSFFLTKGKSNAFIAKQAFPYKKIYFTCGVKRLIYKICLDRQVTLFFAHLSLNKRVRSKQITEIGDLTNKIKGEVIVLGDFNILKGTKEIAQLVDRGELVLLNRESDPTFAFHRSKLQLDLCFCSKKIAKNTELRVIPQPYSDHAALILTIHSDI